MNSVSASNSKRRLLVLARRVPWPLNGGGRIRLHHFMRELSRTWDVTCAALEAPIEDVALPVDVKLICGADIRVPQDHAASPEQLSLGRQFFGFDPEIAAWLQQVGQAKAYDAIFVSGAANGVYVGEAALPTVWDLCDELLLAEWRKLRRNWLRLGSVLHNAAVVASHQREVTRKADHTVVASEVDARWLRALNRGPITAISCGVDLDFFSQPGDPRDIPPVNSSDKPQRIVFVGALEFPPNIDAVCWFARNVWPRVHRQFPRARLQLVGRNPVPAVQALAGQAGIEVHANVPDVRPYYQAAQIVIAPLRMGGGVKTKILEACAMQRATLTSPLGLGDLSVQRGEAILTATRTHEWVDSLSTLLSDTKLCRRLGHAARAWVRENHSWSMIGSALDRLIGDLLSEPHYLPLSPVAEAGLRISNDHSTQIG